MHSITQNKRSHIPLNVVDTSTVFKMMTNKDLNPNYQFIQKLRTFKRCDPEYGKIKEHLQCFTPNASFSVYVDGANVTSSSKFVYMDFDPKDEGFDREKEIKCLNNNPHVYAHWTSAGGIGIGCLLKADWTDQNPITFKSAFTSALNTLKTYGSTMTYLDMSCSNISRLNFISYSKVQIKEDAITIEKPVKEMEGDVKSLIYTPCIKDFASPSSYVESHTKLFYNTQIEDWGIDEPYRFIPEGKPYVKTYVGSEKIPVGQRTTMLFINSCKLAVINHGVTEGQLYTHVWSINKRFCIKPKTPQEVANIVRSVIALRNEGRLYAPSILKYVWFNPAQRHLPKQKQSISMKLIQAHRKTYTLDLLTNHIQDLRDSGIKITQASLAEISGKNLRTVKRYWESLKEFVF